MLNRKLLWDQSFDGAAEIDNIGFLVGDMTTLHSYYETVKLNKKIL